MTARVAIWIVSDPRPEHVAAVTWLNESSSVEFYMVKVEAVRIGDSPAAPLFTLIVGPSKESKEVGQAKKNIAERYSIRKRWWTSLIERSAKVTKLHAHITPGEYSWIGASSGIRGLNFNYTVIQDEWVQSCISIEAKIPKEKTIVFRSIATGSRRSGKVVRRTPELGAPRG